MSKAKKKNRMSSFDGKKAGGGIKRVLINTCCIFTVLIFISHLLYTAIYDGKPFETNIAFTAGIFILSFISSLATMTYSFKKLSFWQSHLIVFLVVGAAYYFLTVVLTNNSRNFNGTVAAMSVYVIAFLIITAVILIVKAVKKKKNSKAQDTTYISKF